jgi:accessory colonization factor AcfC
MKNLLIKIWGVFGSICLINSAPLPDKLLIGYANWGECDDKIIQAVENGVNVVIWFAINLVTDENGNQEQDSMIFIF